MKLTDAEWLIMKVVWERSPFQTSARDVHEQVEPTTQWAYTTVKTMMNRLVEKGVLSSRLRANTTLYTAKLSCSRARRAAVTGLVEKAFDGAFSPLLHFLVADERLSEQEKRELASLLEVSEEEE